MKTPRPDEGMTLFETYGATTSRPSKLYSVDVARADRAWVSRRARRVATIRDVVLALLVLIDRDAVGGSGQRDRRGRRWRWRGSWDRKGRRLGGRAPACVGGDYLEHDREALIRPLDGVVIRCDTAGQSDWTLSGCPCPVPGDRVGDGAVAAPAPDVSGERCSHRRSSADPGLLKICRWICASGCNCGTPAECDDRGDCNNDTETCKYGS